MSAADENSCELSAAQTANEVAIQHAVRAVWAAWRDGDHSLPSLSQLLTDSYNTWWCGAMAVLQVPPVVHLLKGGLTPCGMPALPSQWPEGHTWTDDPNSPELTCPWCKE